MDISAFRADRKILSQTEKQTAYLLRRKHRRRTAAHKDRGYPSGIPVFLFFVYDFCRPTNFLIQRPAVTFDTFRSCRKGTESHSNYIFLHKKGYEYKVPMPDSSFFSLLYHLLYRTSTILYFVCTSFFLFCLQTRLHPLIFFKNKAKKFDGQIAIFVPYLL